jgi:hypothetical protein
MEPAKPEAVSVWPRRLIIGGILLAVVGFFLMLGQGASIDAIFNPETTNIAEFTGEESEEFELEKGCYRLIQVTSTSSLNVSLTAVDGSDLSGEAIAQSKCMPDWQSQSTTSTYSTSASWKIDEGSYFLEISCEEDCSSTKSWFISVDKMQQTMLGNNLLIVGLSMCCVSIFILPFGLILYYSNSKNRNPNVIVMNQHGQPVHLQNLPPHIAEQIQQELTNFNTPQQSVAPPFADRPVQHQDHPEVRDGTLEVQQGKLMTTEQVYALMRGDIESAQNPAMYSPKDNEKVMEDAANAAAIASWDEGVATPTVEVKKLPTITQPKNPRTQPQEKNSSSWKDWDEMN